MADDKFLRCKPTAIQVRGGSESLGAPLFGRQVPGMSPATTLPLPRPAYHLIGDGRRRCALKADAVVAQAPGKLLSIQILQQGYRVLASKIEQALELCDTKFRSPRVV